MSESIQFTNEVILVTGSGRGLGRAFAECIGAAGATVIVNDTGATDAGQSVCDGINAAGGRAEYVPGHAEQSDQLVGEIIERCGRLDGVVHNAGILRDKTLRKMSDEQWDTVLDVHLKSCFTLARAAWPHFESQGGGSLLFITSAAGLYGNFGQSNYAAAKMGMYGLCRSIALEGDQANIRCNCLAPFGATEMNSSSWPEEQKVRLKTEYVAPLVGYLVHPECPSTGGMFEASAGGFKQVRWERSHGLTLPLDQPMTIGDIAAGWSELSDFNQSDHPQSMREALYNMRND